MKKQKNFIQVYKLFTVLFLLSSCGKSSKPTLPMVQPSNLFSEEESKYLESVKTSIEQSQETTLSKIDFSSIEYIKEDDLFRFSGKGYECHAQSLEYKGNIVVLSGDTQDIEDEFKENGLDFIHENFSKIKNIALNSKRIFCVHDLNPTNLYKVSQFPNLEFLIIIGHGEYGDLNTKPLENLNPITLSHQSFKFTKNQTLIMADFINCQVGQNEDEWVTSFPEHTIVNMKEEDISVEDARHYLNSEYLKALITASNEINCDGLSPENRELINQLNQQSKCIIK